MRRCRRSDNLRRTLQPSIEGAAGVGATLTAYTGVWSGARLEPAYAWQRCRGESCDTVGDRTDVPRPRGGSRRLPARERLGARHRERRLRTDRARAAARSKREPSVDLRPGARGRDLASRSAAPGRARRSRSRRRWIRCRATSCRGGVEVGHGLRYRVRAADRGRRLQVVVTATNTLGSVTAASRPTARVG